jgi:hypothetical protein
MKLCIADPPYLGRGAALYGPDALTFPSKVAGGPRERVRAGDANKQAEAWDDPAAHRIMVERLISDFDGWCIALNADNLFEYLAWVPRDTRICSWHKRDPFPAGRIVRSWEPVLVYVPQERRTRGETQMRDTLTTASPKAGLIGAKPPAWTRWVLDMLGYDPETDTVDDLFHGSGAVAAEVAQGVLL